MVVSQGDSPSLIITPHSLTSIYMYTKVLQICKISGTYVERILCFSNVLFIAFFAFNHIDHVSRFAISRGFYWICFPSDRALEHLNRLDVVTTLTTSLLTLRIPLMKGFLLPRNRSGASDYYSDLLFCLSSIA